MHIVFFFLSDYAMYLQEEYVESGGKKRRISREARVPGRDSRATRNTARSSSFSRELALLQARSNVKPLSQESQPIRGLYSGNLKRAPTFARRPLELRGLKVGAGGARSQFVDISDIGPPPWRGGAGSNSEVLRRAFYTSLKVSA